MKQKIEQKWVPILIAIVVVGVIGGVAWTLNQNPERLTGLQVRFGLLSEDEAQGIYTVSGFIEADETRVDSEIRGRIALIGVDEGDVVEAGQAVIVLDTDLLEAEVKGAQAQLNIARAQLAQAKAGVRPEEITRAEAALALVQADADAAYTRWQDALLLRDNPQELDMQIDAARTDLELAELRIAAARPATSAAEAVWDLRREQWEWMQDDHNMCRTNPVTGQKMCRTISFDEGPQQDIGVAWNYSGADRWAAWVDLNSADAALVNTKQRLDDLLQLRRDPQEARVKVAQAEAAYQTALAEVEVAQARLETLKAQPRAEQVALAETQVKQAEADLMGLKVQFEKHILEAPRSGQVVARVTHEGEMAAPGAAMLTIADLSQLTLTVYVPAPDVGRVSIDQEVSIFVDAFPGEPFTGYVTFIGDKAEFTPKNVQTKEERVNTVFAVKIRLGNPDQRLKPGMPADVILAAEPQL